MTGTFINMSMPLERVESQGVGVLSAGEQPVVEAKTLRKSAHPMWLRERQGVRVSRVAADTFVVPSRALTFEPQAKKGKKMLKKARAAKPRTSEAQASTVQALPSGVPSTIQDKTEVEMKVFISREQFENTKKLLHTIATFKEEVPQADHYVKHPALPFQGTLRVRQCPGQNSICLKIPQRGTLENDFFRQEYQVPVGNTEDMLEIFRILGFQEEKLLQKNRTIFTYNDYEIVLDDISGIGYSLEIEMKRPVSDRVQCMNEMEAFLCTELKVTQYKKELCGIEAYRTNDDKSKPLS